MNEEKEKIRKLIEEYTKQAEEQDPGVDYASEYRKQTGKDLETGEYTTQ